MSQCVRACVCACVCTFLCVWWSGGGGVNAIVNVMYECVCCWTDRNWRYDGVFVSVVLKFSVYGCFFFFYVVSPAFAFIILCGVSFSRLFIRYIILVCCCLLLQALVKLKHTPYSHVWCVCACNCCFFSASNIHNTHIQVQYQHQNSARTRSSLQICVFVRSEFIWSFHHGFLVRITLCISWCLLLRHWQGRCFFGLAFVFLLSHRWAMYRHSCHLILMLIGLTSACRFTWYGFTSKSTKNNVNLEH